MLHKTRSILAQYGNENDTQTHEKFRHDLQNAYNKIYLRPQEQWIEPEPKTLDKPAVVVD